MPAAQLRPAASKRWRRTYAGWISFLL